MKSIRRLRRWLLAAAICQFAVAGLVGHPVVMWRESEGDDIEAALMAATMVMAVLVASGVISLLARRRLAALAKRQGGGYA